MKGLRTLVLPDDGYLGRIQKMCSSARDGEHKSAYVFEAFSGGVEVGRQDKWTSLLEIRVLTYWCLVGRYALSMTRRSKAIMAIGEMSYLNLW